MRRRRVQMIQGCRYQEDLITGNHQVLAGIGLHHIVDLMLRFQDHFRRAIYDFGACIIGMGMNPQIMQDFRVGTDWRGDRGGVTGQHAVAVIGYDPSFVECITWGGRQRMDWEFFNRYVFEAYMLVGPEWIRPNGTSLTGYNQAGLSDLATKIWANEFIIRM